MANREGLVWSCPLCHPQPLLTSLAFRAKPMQRLLQELDGHRDVDPQGMFSLLFQCKAEVKAPGLSRGNITPIIQTISITPVLSKVFERLLVGELSVFLEKNVALPARQYTYWKRLGICDTLLDICR